MNIRYLTIYKFMFLIYFWLMGWEKYFDGKKIPCIWSFSVYKTIILTVIMFWNIDYNEIRTKPVKENDANSDG